MNKHKHNGFTILEGLLILVIVGIVGFTGWYVLNSKNKAETSYDVSKSISATKKTQNQYHCNSNEKTKTWTAVTSINKGFTICLPNGLTAVNLSGLDGIEIFPFIYKDGQKLKVVYGPGFAGDGVYDGFQLFKANQSYLGWANEHSKKITFKLNDGTEATRYYIVFGKPTGFGPEPSEGDVAYEYLLDVKGHHYHAAYAIPNGGKNYLDLIEESLKTLNVN